MKGHYGHYADCHAASVKRGDHEADGDSLGRVEQATDYRLHMQW